MKSVINDLFLPDSRARRRKGLVSESQERILASPSHLSSLHRLGKRSEQVFCPYCKQATQTRVEQTDSRTTKGVNAILWMGMGDPFALTTLDWCQNIDHFCSRCNGHLTHKPYRGEVQAVPEDTLLELPLGDRHEKIEFPAKLNHVSESDGDRRLTVQRDAGKEALLGSRSSENQGNRTLNPAELDRGVYQPPLISHNQTLVLTEIRETKPLELLGGQDQSSAQLPGEGFHHSSERRNPAQSSATQSK
jgi:ribosomal protein L44E